MITTCIENLSDINILITTEVQNTHYSQNHGDQIISDRPRQKKSFAPMKVKFKRVNAIAIWKWNVPNDDVCGICRVPFDGCCPDCHIPGDDCPILTGQCKHVFHMSLSILCYVNIRHCIEKWINTPESKAQCPMDRQRWGMF